MAGWRSNRSASYCLRLLGLIWGQLTHELCQPWLIHLVHGLASSHLTLDCRQEVHAPAIFSLLRLEPQAGAGGMCGVMVVRSAESVVSPVFTCGLSKLCSLCMNPMMVSVFRCHEVVSNVSAIICLTIPTPKFGISLKPLVSTSGK